MPLYFTNTDTIFVYIFVYNKKDEQVKGFQGYAQL